MAATVAVTETAVVTMGRYRRDATVVTAAAVATGGSRKQFGVTTAGTDKNQPFKRETLVVAAAEIEAAAKDAMVVGKVEETEFVTRWRKQW
jgi:hypothetical protein